MLALDKVPDGLRWAERAESLFPDCFPLALLGIDTYPLDQRADLMLRLLDRIGRPSATTNDPLALTTIRDAIWD